MSSNTIPKLDHPTYQAQLAAEADSVTRSMALHPEWVAQQLATAHSIFGNSTAEDSIQTQYTCASKQALGAITPTSFANLAYLGQHAPSDEQRVSFRHLLVRLFQMYAVYVLDLDTPSHPLHEGATL